MAHRGQRRPGVAAVEVVEADDRDVLWDPPAGGGELGDHRERELVIEAHHRGLREFGADLAQVGPVAADVRWDVGLGPLRGGHAHDAVRHAEAVRRGGKRALALVAGDIALVVVVGLDPRHAAMPETGEVLDGIGDADAVIEQDRRERRAVVALEHDHAAACAGDPGRKLPVERPEHDQRVDALVIEELQRAFERLVPLAPADEEDVVAALMGRDLHPAADRGEEGMLEQAGRAAAHRQADGVGAPGGEGARVVVAAIAEGGGGLAHALDALGGEVRAAHAAAEGHARGGAAHASEGGDVLEGRRIGLGCHRGRACAMRSSARVQVVNAPVRALTRARASRQACSRS